VANGTNILINFQPQIRGSRLPSKLPGLSKVAMALRDYVQLEYTWQNCLTKKRFLKENLKILDFCTYYIVYFKDCIALNPSICQ